MVLWEGMKKYWKWVLLIALMVGLPWGGYQLYIRDHHLSFVPEAMNVSNVLYVSEQSWGFGPGGNETGLLVFEIPTSVAEELKDRGIDYLKGLPANTRQGWHGRYTDWHETPLIVDDDWGSASYEGQRYWTSPGIGDYLNKYGFPVPLDGEWEHLANRALSTPGNFYAYGRIGLIIIVPDELRVIYAYNG